MVTRHNLKIWPEFFADIVSGAKKYEVRVNDRGFKIDDELNLQEWNPNTAVFTGASCTVKVVHITHGSEVPGSAMRPNLCVMGIEVVK